MSRSYPFIPPQYIDPATGETIIPERYLDPSGGLYASAEIWIRRNPAPIWDVPPEPILFEPEPAPETEEPPPVPTLGAEPSFAAMLEERRKLRRRKGFRSTIRTSPMGVLEEPPVLRQTLLGA
jgi:hypothetical protein